MNKEVLDKTIFRIALHDGVTINTETGDIPSAGYAVAFSKGTEEKWGAKAFWSDAPGIVADYVRRHAASLALPDNYLGVWIDSATQTVFLDISTVVGTFEEARTIGKASGQIAVFDIGIGEEIRL